MTETNKLYNIVKDTRSMLTGDCESVPSVSLFNSS